MSLILYAHPFSSYSQKVLVALYENATPFEWRVLDGSPAVTQESTALWPLARLPVLLDARLADRPWAAGELFSLADCAAAPSLFYADWVQPIAPAFAHLRAYRARLLARPSFKRAVDEARPFRRFFPPGAPDRD